MSHHVYGIDLGTTYSCIAYRGEDGKPVVVTDEDDDATLPSVVEWGFDGNVTVGKNAKEDAVADPKRVAMFFKGLMGKENAVAQEIDGKAITPVEASAEVLRALAKRVKDRLGDDVTDVVITCPAHFGPAEREATKAAGRLAGLNVLSLYEEPSAAALCYGVLDLTTDKNILVYDLGGGTFDVTVMSIQGGKLRVVSKNGDSDLGGKKWDAALGELLIEKFADATGVDPKAVGSPEELMDLQVEAENTKRRLSAKPTASVSLHFAEEGTTVTVTRQEFEERTEGLLEATLDMTRDVIDEARANGVSVDQILLVGGSTRMPQVPEGIAARFGIEPQVYDPDLAVAKGAAIFATLPKDKQSLLALEGNKSAESTLPVVGGSTWAGYIPLAAASFGVEAFTDSTHEQTRVYTHVMKNDELPKTVEKTYRTSRPDAPAVRVTVYQFPERADECAVEKAKLVGEVHVELDEGTPKGSPIAISVGLAEDGTVDGYARDERSGRSVPFRFELGEGIIGHVPASD